MGVWFERVFFVLIVAVIGSMLFGLVEIITTAPRAVLRFVGIMLAAIIALLCFLFLIVAIERRFPLAFEKFKLFFQKVKGPLEITFMFLFGLLILWGVVTALLGDERCSSMRLRFDSDACQYPD